MRHIVVTPAGRRRYLEILVKHLVAQKQDFDEWHLWVNTNDVEDIAYCHWLAEQHPSWIKCVSSTMPPDGNQSIHQFFAYCIDPNTVYTRLDDDIVWLEPGFLRKMYNFRLSHPQYFLVYGTIVNNALTSYIYQQRGLIDHSHGSCNYEVMDNVGWKSAEFAEHVHRTFIKDLNEGKTEMWYVQPQVLHDYERMSINAISWLGSEFAKFQGLVGIDEEQWISVDKPKSIGTRNIVCGDALVVHFSFYPQREHLDKTDILTQYMQLAPWYLDDIIMWFLWECFIL